MLTISDILKLLDKIPIWNQLKNLPAKVEKLELRIAELENPQPKSQHDQCPKCHDYSFELISSEPHPDFGEMGVKNRLYRCSNCDFKETKFIE